MREYFRREFIGPILRFLLRIVMVVSVILIVDVIGLGIFLFSSGLLNLVSFIEFLVLLLFLEGALIGAAGALLLYGYSEYKLAGQAAINPAFARDQLEKWKERRLPQ